MSSFLPVADEMRGTSDLDGSPCSEKWCTDFDNVPDRGSCTSKHLFHSNSIFQLTTCESGAEIGPDPDNFRKVSNVNTSTLPIGRTITILPTLEDFDKGVHALARAHRLVCPLSLPNPAQSATIIKSLQAFTQNQLWWSHKELVAREFSKSHRSQGQGSVIQIERYALFDCHDVQPLQGHSECLSVFSDDETSQIAPTRPDSNYCHSPLLQNKKRSTNQKYTTEEGDFIIYAFLDKKMRWEYVLNEFHQRFGYTPKHTVQGLQVWYYRMNQRIPMWDQDGWLHFDHEDGMEPRYKSIRSRGFDDCERALEPPGIAQRYPERAVRYERVDLETKLLGQDWAKKRGLQYHKRRERRQEKEQWRVGGILLPDKVVQAHIPIPVRHDPL